MKNIITLLSHAAQLLPAPLFNHAAAPLANIKLASPPALLPGVRFMWLRMPCRPFASCWQHFIYLRLAAQLRRSPSCLPPSAWQNASTAVFCYSLLSQPRACLRAMLLPAKPLACHCCHLTLPSHDSLPAASHSHCHRHYLCHACSTCLSTLRSISLLLPTCHHSATLAPLSPANTLSLVLRVRYLYHHALPPLTFHSFLPGFTPPSR